MAQKQHALVFHMRSTFDACGDLTSFRRKCVASFRRKCVAKFADQTCVPTHGGPKEIATKTQKKLTHVADSDPKESQPKPKKNHHVDPNPCELPRKPKGNETIANWTSNWPVLPEPLLILKRCVWTRPHRLRDWLICVIFCPSPHVGVATLFDEGQSYDFINTLSRP